jgi:flap endonuclease-1
MGIKNLGKLLDKYSENATSEITYKNLENTTIAIDTSIVIYQFLVAIKSNTQDLQTDDNRITSHIYGIINKTLSFIKKKINPVFIFDGEPPDIKNLVLDERKKNKSIAQAKLLEETDPDELIKLQKKSVKFSKLHSNECKEILELMGIPYVQAPEEADPQCAYMVKEGLVDYVLSEDMDLLTFGTTKLIRGLTNGKSRVYNLKDILEDLKLTLDQFIDMCILLGCDYTSTIEGIGLVKSYKFIKKYKSIEKIISKEKKFKPEAEFNFIAAREYFKNAPVTTNVDVKRKPPNIELLKNKLIEYQFSKDSINNIISVLTNTKVKQVPLFT